MLTFLDVDICSFVTHKASNEKKNFIILMWIAYFQWKAHEFQITKPMKMPSLFCVERLSTLEKADNDTENTSDNDSSYLNVFGEILSAIQTGSYQLC